MAPKPGVPLVGPIVAPNQQGHGGGREPEQEWKKRLVDYQLDAAISTDCGFEYLQTCFFILDALEQ